jgi:hypothetical protein
VADVYHFRPAGRARLQQLDARSARGAQRVLSLATAFADGTHVVTSNQRGNTAPELDDLPGVTRQLLAWQAPIEALLKVHAATVTERLTAPVPTTIRPIHTEADVDAVGTDMHARALAHLRALSWIDGPRHRAAWREQMLEELAKLNAGAAGDAASG